MATFISFSSGSVRSVEPDPEKHAPSTLSLPLKNGSLAEEVNSSKERSDDRQGKAGAIHARIQVGSGSAGEERSKHAGRGSPRRRNQASRCQPGTTTDIRPLNRGRTAPT